MYFLYVDESGDASHTKYFVMTGILVNNFKLRKNSKDLNKIIREFLEKNPKREKEVKTSKIFNNKSSWGSVDFEIRKKFIDDICSLINDCASLYCIMIEFKKFKDDIFEKNCWLTAGMLLSANVQKKMQKKKKNKGNTVLVFDSNEKNMSKLCELLHNSEDKYDILYDFKKSDKNERFDQIINTAFSIKSEQSSFVQAADCVAYIYRRQMELSKGGKEKNQGEKDLIGKFFNKLEENRVKFGKMDKKMSSKIKGMSPKSWTF